MRSALHSRALRGFTLVELVAVLVILTFTAVVAYAPLRDGIQTLRTDRACQVIEGQFGVSFERIKSEFRQAGTILNVKTASVDSGEVAWVTYQTAAGDIRLLYYRPGNGQEIPGQLWYYSFDDQANSSDPSGIQAHNSFVTSAAATDPSNPIPGSATVFATRIEGFGLNLIQVIGGLGTTVSNISLADYLHVEAKPYSPECVNLPPMVTDVGLRGQGSDAKALTISEVMYEDTDGSDDFVEITNTTSNSVNLLNMQLVYEPVDGAPATVNLPSRTLLPGERAIISGGSSSIVPARRDFPLSMSTHTLVTPGGFPANLSGAATLTLIDPSDATTPNASNCPDHGVTCEDLVKWGDFLYEDFNWGDTSNRVADASVAQERGWELSTSAPVLSQSGILGVTHRRVNEVISGSTITNYPFLPDNDADGNSAGGVLLSFELSGSKALNSEWWVSNTKQLVIQSASDIIINFKTLREFDLSGGANREFAVDYCEQLDACWSDEADATWQTIPGASTNVDTSQSGALPQEMRASDYATVSASAYITTPGTYKFRLRYKTAPAFGL